MINILPGERWKKEKKRKQQQKGNSLPGKIMELVYLEAKIRFCM